ncbi:hypothetical protein B0T17DRAFT_509222 [Bombardia bombarda]|uniref:Uncharacterized protein n=1 Tax=Bombardia bombarda TaxID=252184 RepID=A0AA40C1H6_9PEZI|nr:hypothetical protein B0T17DRAFT_509222 [Bombardia bombarda]
MQLTLIATLFVAAFGFVAADTQPPCKVVPAAFWDCCNDCLYKTCINDPDPNACDGVCQAACNGCGTGDGAVIGVVCLGFEKSDVRGRNQGWIDGGRKVEGLSG